MKFAVLGHTLLASLAAIVLGAVGFILAAFFAPSNALTPAQYSAIPPSLRSTAVIGRALNPPTNVWTTVGIVCGYLVVVGVPVAIISGLWANKLKKEGARPGRLFHFREEPDHWGVAMMNHINKRPTPRDPRFSNFADGK
jgi:hypothetical protein